MAEQNYNTLLPALWWEQMVSEPSEKTRFEMMESAAVRDT